MPLYIYKAVDMDGTRYKGKLERNSPKDVASFITELGYIPLEIKPDNIFNADITDIKLFMKRVGKKDIALFCRQLWFVLDAGVAITAGFKLLSRNNKNKAFQKILNVIYEQIQKGESLSECMKKHREFPIMLINMVKVGELSGSLPLIMGKMADYYERDYQAADEVKSAMLYPLIVSMMMLCVISAAVMFVVPSYAQIFIAADITMPAPTRMLISISGFITSYYSYILAVFIIVIIIAHFFLKSATGRFCKGYVQLHTPIYRVIYTKLVNLRFSQVMSLMLDSGQQMVISLETARQVLNNAVLDDALKKASAKIEEGEALWMLLDNIPCFGTVLADMVRIGEETGRLSHAMLKCADYFQQEADSVIQRLNKLIEPVITIILGLLLAFIMLAIMLPTFAMVDLM